MRRGLWRLGNGRPCRRRRCLYYLYHSFRYHSSLSLLHQPPLPLDDLAFLSSAVLAVLVRRLVGLRLAEIFRQRADGWRFEEADRRDIDVQLFFELGNDSDPDQRIAAQLEKVVVDADLLDAQHVLPDARDAFLQLLGWRDIWVFDVRPWMGRSGRLGLLQALQDARSGEIFGLLDHFVNIAR